MKIGYFLSCDDGDPVEPTLLPGGGRHYRVEHCRVYDLPERPPPIIVSSFGPKAVELAAQGTSATTSPGGPPSPPRWAGHC